jgi:peptidase M28-like protein
MLAGIAVASRRAAPRPNRVRFRISALLLFSLAAAGVGPSCADAQPPQSVAAKEKPMLVDPGQSFVGPLAKLTDHEAALAESLKKDVQKLAGDIGERSVPNYAKLVEAAAFLEKSLQDDGYQVGRQIYEVKGRSCANLEVEIQGTKAPSEIVVIGAHYDSLVGTVGANDNGSGVAGMLALARAWAGKPTARTLRFVAFANEEPPYFQEAEMGSLHYAQRCKQRGENIVAMLSLETIGYYSDAPNSQHYPPPLGYLYPSTGNFIGFIADRTSEPLVRQVIASFRKHAAFPSQWGAMPTYLPGVGWSDHWSFWQQGYPGVMVTDTALYRYPHYHLPSDTPDKIDYPCLARVVAGLEQVVADLTAVPEPAGK